MSSPLRTNARKSPAVMVVHGPEVFDQGDAAWFLGRMTPSRILVTGVMARTAAEESGLDVEYDCRPPSRVIADLEGPVFLFTRGRTKESGRVFGDIVASRLGKRGLVHVECSSETVFTWNNGDSLLALGLSGLTGFASEDAAGVDEPAEGVRKIRGCIPGEPVCVSGIVIGRATEETVVLKATEAGIEPVGGLDPKLHGLEKLRRFPPQDICTAWCKSGVIRSGVAKGGCRAGLKGRIMVIDHCGHEIYKRLGADCCGVLAIGDDTTAVCGHICMHRGIPVLGITDNDSDAIVPPAFAPWSLVLDTQPERDDDLGTEIAGMVPDGEVCWDEWVTEVLDRFAGRISVVLDHRGDRP